jgi:hypothetical protein
MVLQAVQEELPGQQRIIIGSVEIQRRVRKFRTN